MAPLVFIEPSGHEPARPNRPRIKRSVEAQTFALRRIPADHRTVPQRSAGDHQEAPQEAELRRSHLAGTFIRMSPVGPEQTRAFVQPTSGDGPKDDMSGRHCRSTTCCLLSDVASRDVSIRAPRIELESHWCVLWWNGGKEPTKPQGASVTLSESSGGNAVGSV